MANVLLPFFPLQNRVSDVSSLWLKPIFTKLHYSVKVSDHHEVEHCSHVNRETTSKFGKGLIFQFRFLLCACIRLSLLLTFVHVKIWYFKDYDLTLRTLQLSVKSVPGESVLDSPWRGRATIPSPAFRTRLAVPALSVRCWGWKPLARDSSLLQQYVAFDYGLLEGF